MSTNDKREQTKARNHVLNRRNILLGGTTLAAAAVGGTAPIKVAQAQAQPAAPSGQRPNILVIFGDDVGYWNISAYNQGMMGFKTPNIDRIAREGALFTDYYAPAILHRRARRVHHRPVAVPHRIAQGRPAGRGARSSERRPDHCRPSEEPRLHDIPARQEPPRRPQRVPAHRAWLR